MPLALLQETVGLYGPQSLLTVHADFQMAPAGAADGPAGEKMAARRFSMDG
ncbi:MAG TPA: hypothetical protein VFC23_07840 [Thermoanaerobaculia bacterium]|nr:hypothetical protein [Thermoanaerobaculia bacterium]